MRGRPLHWLGFDAPPDLGLAVCDDAILLALVRRRAPAVVGLGAVPLERGVVVGGEVRRPTVAADAVVGVLGQVHCTRPPTVAAVVSPAGPTAATGPGIVRADVADRPTASTAGPDLRSRVETIPVAHRAVTSVAELVGELPGPLHTIEPTPVSVARFLRFARPAPLRFARMAEHRTRWLLCDGDGGFELDLADDSGGVSTLVDGPDPTSMRPSDWGAVTLHRVLRQDHPQPGRFAAPIGAALGIGAPDVGPWCDLTAAAPDGAEPEPTGWSMERVQ